MISYFNSVTCPFNLNNWYDNPTNFKSYFHKINLLMFDKICLSQNKIYSSILIFVEGNQLQKHFLEFWGRHLLWKLEM